MDKLSIDALAGRLEVLEREKHRWKCLAGGTALGLALLLASGGPLGSRVIIAQPLEKVGNPVPRRMEYKVSESHLPQSDG